MTNPPPRPALRKAPDADQHPALPPRALAVAAGPGEDPSAARAAAGRTAAAGAPTSPPVPPGATAPGPGVPSTSSTSATTGSATGATAGSASDTLRPRKAKKDKAHRESRDHRKRRRDLAVPARADKDKTVVVEVPMPKSLRRSLDARAEELGYSREETVLLLLRAWIDG